ncbi:helix-turn-helix domain-containing protein [Mycolicibacter sinensis]|uniref:HTH cro/C1-type domain-containing protein n=1 Tax=Mycolicibacter sinensis (strain JDM601) TaxID=875328 RepID=A0A1A2E432_MYCSD|nr:helix-turn-helix transcriptional regulator [Mycolicibacter sinensis]OBF98874.1 hypothetical protein A5772_13585 [Mycolicibacter sinensis]OBG00911.1 hypothetical protein A5771_17750 [Mycolicibacter sinensis]
MESRSPVENRFRERVSHERKLHGWSQAELAKMLTAKGIRGVYATTVAKIESGERAVRINEAAALADLFSTTTDALLGRLDPDENSLTFAMMNTYTYAESARQQTVTADETTATLEEILEDAKDRFASPEIEHLLELSRDAARHLKKARQSFEQVSSGATDVIVAKGEAARTREDGSQG